MKITVTIMLLLLGTTSFAQPLTPKEEVYEILRAHSILNSPYRETAKKAFEDYISKYPTNPYRLVATYWLAEILYKLNDVDSSRLNYIQVLDIPVPDSVDDANYFRHSAALRLADIYIARGDYSAALNYLDIAKLKFIMRFDCGNARIEDGIRMNVLYSSCYIEQGNSRQAIDLLTPYMFGGWNGSDTIVFNKLYEAYLKIYTKEEIRNEFLNAVKTVEIKEKRYNESFSLLEPMLIIFGRQIKFDDWDLDLKKVKEQERKQKCMETIRQSAIYKLATR